MVILVVSDVHLGYDKSNVDDFNAFLQYVKSDRADVDTLVILGDFVDMWRRDISGLFLENHETLQDLLELKKRITVYYVVGNHDFHLLHLVDHKYPFEFKTDLTLPKNDPKYVFKHGWEFDLEQRPYIMELFSENTSDKGGQIGSDIWKVITGKNKNFDYIKNYAEQYQKKYMQKGYLKRFTKYPKAISEFEIDEKYLESLLMPPFERLTGKFDIVEWRAAHSVEDKKLLVFGHTHRPFYSKEQYLVNTGSWVRDEKTFNTWVELDGDEVRVKQYPHLYPRTDITDSKAIKRIADITDSKAIKRIVPKKKPID